jgi:hypothetical protein
VVRVAWLVLLLALLIACAGGKKPAVQPTGTSDLEVLPPPPYEPPPEGARLKRGPLVLPYEVEDRSSPGYPEAALADEIACSARLLYHILRDGSAKLVRLEWEAPPPPEYETAFEEEILQAMASWRYTPARKMVPVKHEDGSTELVLEPVPKAERAIVRFRVEQGRGIVE